MAQTESRISLDPDGNDFILRRVDSNGITTSIKLSETDILTLAQSAQPLQLEILRRHDPPGGDYLAVAVTELEQIAVHDESLGEAILMTLIARNGSRLTYSFPLALAKDLVARLPPRIGRLESMKSTKQ